MCVTDHYDMTIAVKVALNPNTTNQPHCFAICFSFRRSCMCSRFSYFLTLIQNEVMVICNWLKSMHMFIQQAPAAILACTFMKTLFTGTANANRSLMALVYTNENNLYQPFSQTTNVRFFQTERVFRRQFQLRWNWQKSLQTGRKHCRKRRNCSFRAISPFPTVFSNLKDLRLHRLSF